MRPHFDYGDILYGKPDIQSSERKIEKVQYKACIAITGAIQATSRKLLYDDLGLISLKERRWYSKLTFFYEIVNWRPPDYQQSSIEVSFQDNYPLRSLLAGKLKAIPYWTKSFKKNIFSVLYCWIE